MIREEDLRVLRPDPVALAYERIVQAEHETYRRIEGELLWFLRRNLALACLAGWQPPTAAEKWWDRYEADALAFAEQFT